MKKIYEGIGLMSGTSLDGLDIAHCRFVKRESWSFKLLHAMTIPYSDNWKNRLHEAPKLKGNKLLTLDIELGSWMGEQTKGFIDLHNIQPKFIASHGHTIFHQPERQLTLQIGNANQIYKSTRLPIVYDFRSLDVAFGGQGAPLVPVGDHYLFNEYHACLNLGGIANISMVKDNHRIAFDIAPANMPLNYLVKQMGKEYDDKGEIASSGNVDLSLFDKLNGLEYYNIIGSKSLGYEWVNSNIYPLLNKQELNTLDLLATISEHIGYQIGNNLPKGKVLVTGGGVYNTHLINQIKKYSPDSVLIFPSKEIIEFKEALIFSFLGLLRLRNEINCFRSVTGSSEDSCSGSKIGVFSP